MRSLLMTAVALSLVACGTAVGQGAPASPTHPHPSPTAIPSINVDDMMGFYTQQTVFVATADQVSAVTLLNHFTRYQIPTRGVAQVAIDNTSQWLYLLDAPTPGSYRLRRFDVPNGQERVAQDAIASVAADRRSVSTTLDGRVFVLKSDRGHAWVDTYDGLTLRPLGPVMQKPGCGDRLLVRGSRVAIVCLATGEVATDTLRGDHTEIAGTPGQLVAATLADDGTLYVVTAAHRLAALPIGATASVDIPWPSEWSGTVLPDGMASAGVMAVIAERADDGSAWIRVFPTNDMTQRKSHRLDGAPQSGVLMMWPFAYYAIDRTIRHVDLTSGLLETMTDVGAGAIPGAVANR